MNRPIHPDGFMCLVCKTRTKNEGQLCDGCVEKGHRVENETLHLNITPFIASRTAANTRWTMYQPIPDDINAREEKP